MNKRKENLSHLLKYGLVELETIMKIFIRETMVVKLIQKLAENKIL